MYINQAGLVPSTILYHTRRLAADRDYLRGQKTTNQSHQRPLKPVVRDLVMTFQKAFLFLVLLCATVMANVDQQHKQFLKQHVNGQMTIQACENQMKLLNLNRPDGKCKVKNTFILANPENVIQICTGGGTPQGNNLVKSNNAFVIVICTRTGVDSHPNCTYKGSSATKNVIIACEKKLPVHYDGDVDIGTTDGK
ncbi:ribonuclease-like 3 [Oncorhynchus nerka]|uniref:ribonuclease-like 3 n=1 Tax=Oncorhynchus nerka TaxID=8023 RepID=UPI001131DE8A|nr:ribonuclease-like 3 [Oncorhynchus nerka]